MSSDATSQAAAAQSPASLLGSAAVNEKSDVSDVKVAAKATEAAPPLAAAKAAATPAAEAPAAKKVIAQVSYQRNRITGHATTDEVCIRLLEEIKQLEGLAAEDPKHIAVVECLPVMKAVQDNVEAFIGTIRGITKLTPHTEKLVKWLFTASNAPVNAKSAFAHMPLSKARAAETQIQIATRLHRFIRSRINKHDITTKDGKDDITSIDPNKFGFTIYDKDRKPLKSVSKAELVAYRSVLRSAIVLYQALHKNDKPMKQAQSRLNRAFAEQADDDGSVYEDGDGSDTTDAPSYAHSATANPPQYTHTAAGAPIDPAIALLATGAPPMSA